MKDLQAVSHDPHVRLFTSDRPLPQLDPSGDDPPSDAERVEMLRDNCGVTRVEHLPNNIGYVKLDSFDAPSVCGASATAAIGLVIGIRLPGGADLRSRSKERLGR
jgi:hypothetical protein